MVRKKLNIKKLGICIGVILILILLLVVGINKLIEESKLKKTTEYKLGEVGYSTNEIKVILNSFDTTKVNDLLKSKYKSNLTKFINEKYFMYKNMDKYLDYYENNKNTSVKNIIGIVNTKLGDEWYSNILDTDITLKEKMLVNKYYKLDSSYVPEDLIEVSSTYGYNGNYVSESIYDELTDMLSSAREDGYTILVSQGYRSYEDQESAYNDIEDAYGTEEADTLAARPGHSEYQTGLSVELDVYGSTDIEEAKTWLINNSYKYGFILRYPTDKENITGFNSNIWRYRFVGGDISRKIREEDITFDEYYMYYINK